MISRPTIYNLKPLQLRLIKVHSPASWGHINMLEEYNFSEEKLRDTLDILPPQKAP